MKHTHGSIEVVCGSMFSGKTDELIRRLVRATIAKQKVQVFKPAIDIRLIRAQLLTRPLLKKPQIFAPGLIKIQPSLVLMKRNFSTLKL